MALLSTWNEVTTADQQINRILNLKKRKTFLEECAGMILPNALSSDPKML
jgi:hypothetical protein